MRWFILSLVFLPFLSIGCGSQPAPKDDKPLVVKVDGKSRPQPDPNGPDVKKPDPLPKPPDTELNPGQDLNRAKYEAALTDALNLAAEQKWADALAALESARTVQDSEFIQGEITRVKNRLAQEAAALKTVSNIETVLEAGQGNEAAALAKKAMAEFGDGDQAPRLVKLRLQADALQSVDAREEAAPRHQRYRQEGQASLQEKNLRAAALAFELALAAKDDAGLKTQLQELRANLEKYDDRRSQAARLRRDPAGLEDALSALREAEEAWATPQVRQDIDEVTLALQKRRDNVSVADFDVRGDVGLADAGRAIAEELLPYLKPRFDLVERSQLAKVVGELKLEGRLSDDFGGQRELAKLAKVRYLVVGSIRPGGGITILARLVEARTGLVAQTGKITAPTVDEALRQLPDLARQLLMSDEEQLAFAQEQQRKAVRVEPVAVEARLPPPPAFPEPEAPLPPPIFVAPPPPNFGGLGLQNFKALPPPPPPGRPLPPPAAALGVEVRTKHLQVALGLGDNLFRRGQYREAQRHFEFALQLSPGHVDIALRLERCAPHVPPPPALVVVAQPVLVVKPRVAVLNFLTVGDPRLLSPGLGPWTAQQLAPYYSQNFEVVDPAEVYWTMGRLGMTMRDLMDDPNARRWLARAVNLRYFVLGTIEFGSLDVHAYLLDAEHGFVQGSGRVVARDPFDLKLRLGELAQLTQIDRAEEARLLAQAAQFDALVLRGRQAMDGRQFALAMEAFSDALKLRPGHVQVSFYLHRAGDLHRQLAWEQERQRQLAARLTAEEAARRRQWELAREAELSRIRATQNAAADEQRRLAASNALVVQARLAVQTKNFGIALSLFEGASTLRANNDAVLREMAQARAEADRAAQIRAAQEAALREAALNKQREQQLARAKLELEQNRLRELAARKAQEERDALAYRTAFDEGERLLNLKQFEGAIAAYQSALRIKKTDAAEAMLRRALADQSYALAEAKGKEELARVQQNLAKERERRKLAEDKAKANQDLYLAALQLAEQALAQRDFATAQVKYQEAGTYFQTDAVKSGLQRARQAQARALAEAESVKNKAREDANRATRLKELVAAGQVALDIKDYAGAVDSFTQAKKIAPDNLDVLAGLTKAEQARDRALAEARRKSEETARTAGFQQFMKNGKDNLEARRFDAAVVAFQEALKINPGDAGAKSALAQAEKSRQASLTSAKDQETARQKTEAYQKLLAEGRLAIEGKRFDEAIKSFSAAQKVMPGDPLSATALADAQKAKEDARLALAAAAKQRAEELQRAADLQKYLTQARTALAGKDLGAASKALDEAAKLWPTHADVLRARKDLQAAQAQKTQADAEAKNRLVSFQKYMDVGQKSLVNKQYDQAATAFAQAVKLVPDDAKANQGLQQAQKAAAQALQTQANYNQALARGEKALALRKYDEAVAAFQEAVKLAPGDQKTAQLLGQAQQARDAAKTKTPDPKLPDPKTPTFQQQLERGLTLEKQQKFKEAMDAFQEALKMNPKDKQGADGLRRAELGLRVAEGQKHLDAKRFAEAIREFEAALVLSPNNPAVQKLLQKAKQGKK